MVQSTIARQVTPSLQLGPMDVKHRQKEFVCISNNNVCQSWLNILSISCVVFTMAINMHGLKTLQLAVVVARDMIFMFTVVCSPQISIVIVLQQIAYFINALIPMQLCTLQISYTRFSTFFASYIYLMSIYYAHSTDSCMAYHSCIHVI